MDDEENNDDNSSEADVRDSDDEDDGIDELERLGEGERVQLLEDTTKVRETVTKVSYHETGSHFCVHYLLLANPGTTTFIRDHPFDNDRPPCMAVHLLRTQPPEEAHPP